MYEFVNLGQAVCKLLPCVAELRNEITQKKNYFFHHPIAKHENH